MGTMVGDPRGPVILVPLGAYRGDCHRYTGGVWWPAEAFRL